MTNKIKLNSSQLIEEIVVAYGGEPKPDVKGNNYGLLVYDGTVFRVEESVFSAWKSGKLASLTLTEGSRDIINTDDDGNEVSVPVRTYAVSGSATKQQIMSNKIFDAKVSSIDKMLASEVGLDAEKLSKLEAQEL